MDASSRSPSSVSRDPPFLQAVLAHTRTGENDKALATHAAAVAAKETALNVALAEAADKVRAAAEDLLAETEKAMRAEFERKTLAATRQVLATTAPWSRAAVEAENEIAANQARRDALQEALDALRRDVQSL